MARNLPTLVNSAASQSLVRYRLLAEISFVGTTSYLHAGGERIQVGSVVYEPVGTFGGVEPVRESVDSFKQTVKVWLSLLDDTARAEAVQERLFNRQIKLYRCYLNDDGTVVGTPSLAYRGFVSDVKIREADPERGDMIEATLTNRVRRSPAGSYYTKESLQAVYSGDTFFDYLPQIVTAKPAQWGQQSVFFNTGKTIDYGGAFPDLGSFRFRG